MYVKNLLVKMYCLVVILDSEEDVVRFEKLNECFDKVMIEILFYLGIS